jgi:hypothetical protein
MARYRVSKEERTPVRATRSSQITFRLEPDLVEFIDREIDRLNRAEPGLLVTPSTIVRMALRRMMTAPGEGTSSSPEVVKLAGTPIRKKP